jgi:uncharacterized membrane protein YciS (DUF1049 family)
MKLLLNILTILIILAMGAVGVLFALQNTMPVPLDVLVYKFEPRSLALWVLSALAVGGVLGLLISSLIMLRTRAALHASKRQVVKAQTEIDRLRTVGLTDGE